MPWDRSEICAQKLDRRKFCSHHVEDFSKLSLKFMFYATGKTTDPTLTTAWAWVTTLTLGGVLAPRGPAWCGMTTKISRGISATQPDGTSTTQKKWDGTRKHIRIGEGNASIFLNICVFAKTLRFRKIQSNATEKISLIDSIKYLERGFFLLIQAYFYTHF